MFSDPPVLLFSAGNAAIEWELMEGGGDEDGAWGRVEAAMFSALRQWEPKAWGSGMAAIVASQPFNPSTSYTAACKRPFPAHDMWLLLTAFFQGGDAGDVITLTVRTRRTMREHNHLVSPIRSGETYGVKTVGDTLALPSYLAVGAYLCSSTRFVHITSLGLCTTAYPSTALPSHHALPPRLALMDALGYNPFAIQFYNPHSDSFAFEKRVCALLDDAVAKVEGPKTGTGAGAGTGAEAKAVDKAGDGHSDDDVEAVMEAYASASTAQSSYERLPLECLLRAVYQVAAHRMGASVYSRAPPRVGFKRGGGSGAGSGAGAGAGAGAAP